MHFTFLNFQILKHLWFLFLRESANASWMFCYSMKIQNNF